MARADKKRFAFTLSTVLFVVLICFVLSEVCFRIILPYYPAFSRIGNKLYPTKGIIDPNYYMFDPETGYAFLPDIKDPLHEIHTDEFGFRITSRPVDKAKGSIIFVGDSTIFGWAVRDKDTFCYLLSEARALKDYNVINMGVPGYALGHIVAVLKNKVPRFRPRIVVVEILWPWLPFSQSHTLKAWKELDFDFYKMVVAPKREFDLTTVTETFPWYTPRTYLVAKDWIKYLPYQKQIKENLVRPGVRDFSVSPEGEAMLAMNYVTMLEEAVMPLVQSGVKVIFYIHPFQYVVFVPPYENLGKIGRNIFLAQLGALDLGAYLKQEFKGKPFYIDGSHLSPLGHKTVARFFLNKLRDGSY